MTPEKSIFEYDNYRNYLREFYLRAKALNKNFSFRYFSRLLGFKTSSILKMIMDGQRNITVPNIPKFVKVLKLNAEEALFFKNLVLLNQAGTPSEKHKYAKILLAVRSYRKIHPLKEFQYHYYDRWYFTVVRELVGLAEFKEDPEWIAKQIKPSITAYEAKRALEELEKLGLLKRNKQGQLQQTESIIASLDEVTSASLVQFHKEMLKRAAESIDRVERESRELQSVTMSVSIEAVKRLQDLILKFRKETVEILANDDGKLDRIYQLQVQFFPLIRLNDERKPE